MTRKPCSFQTMRDRQKAIEVKWLKDVGALGIGMKGVSEEYGIHKTTLTRILQRHAANGEVISMAQTRPEPQMFRDAEKEGLSKGEVAERLGVTYWAVAQQERSLGLKFRDARYPAPEARVKVDPKTLKPITPPKA
ncbi:MAG: hypothetical protein ACPG4X_16390 [Pikeienuella sp.]